eukprot:1060313-Prymnesium_polylepis.1
MGWHGEPSAPAAHARNHAHDLCPTVPARPLRSWRGSARGSSSCSTTWTSASRRRASTAACFSAHSASRRARWASSLRRARRTPSCALLRPTYTHRRAAAHRCPRQPLAGRRGCWAARSNPSPTMLPS